MLTDRYGVAPRKRVGYAIEGRYPSQRAGGPLRQLFPGLLGTLPQDALEDDMPASYLKDIAQPMRMQDFAWVSRVLTTPFEMYLKTSNEYRG